LGYRVEQFGAEHETVCDVCLWRGSREYAYRDRCRPDRAVVGICSAAVQAVQERLRSAGAYNGAVDGVWGPDSAAALQQFQSNHQLQPTGQLNQATAMTLGMDLVALLGIQQAAIPPAIPPPENLRPSSVRVIQSRLHSLGFYSGGVDGVWGRSTQNAVQQFQQGRGLQPNGQLNPQTLAAMGLPPDSLAYR
jgi:peptidoglycan hydrolase-like protein with peptidoglycan-binding domain